MINEINGLDSTGAMACGGPDALRHELPGGERRAEASQVRPGDEAGLVGGYLDANGTPNNGLAGQLAYVDGALGELVAALKDNARSTRR